MTDRYNATMTNVTPPPIPGPWVDDTAADTSRFDETAAVAEPEEILTAIVDDLISTDTEKVKRFKRITTVGDRMQKLLDGELTVEDLDDEEIIKGQLRASNGSFTGRKAAMIPRAMHDEFMRRVLARGQDKLREDFFSAIDTVTEIMKDTQNDAGIRLRAADMILGRVAGKPVEKVELSVEMKPWETMMQGIMKEIPAEDIIDATVISDNGNDEDE